MLPIRVLLLSFPVVFGAWCFAEGTPKRPLDLPVNVSSNELSDDEAPDVIRFFGNEVEGETFFFLLVADRLGASPCTVDTLRAETADGIRQLSSSSRFFVGAVGQWGLESWSREPRLAKRSARSAGSRWVCTQPLDSGLASSGYSAYSLLESIESVISAANDDSPGAAGATILILSNTVPEDREPVEVDNGCGGVLVIPGIDVDEWTEQLTSRNTEDSAIHTHLVGNRALADPSNFWRQLAARNSGVYTEIDECTVTNALAGD